MRSDLILPVLLLFALMALAVYATTGSNHRAKVELVTVPANCQISGALERLPELKEASGLAASKLNRGVLWSHNDSSDATIYAIGSDGRLAGRVQVAGASVVDWEAIAVGTCSGTSCVYVGDIGDNGKNRRTITVYRAPEPSPSDATTSQVDTLIGEYPDGPQDAEGLFVASEALFVVTKGENSPVRVYRFPAAQGNAPLKLQLVATLTAQSPDKAGRVTDAAASPNGRWIAMRTNDVVLFYETAALLQGHPGTPLAFDLRALKEPQGEGIAWMDEQTLYLTGEAEGGGTFGRMSCTLPR